MLRLVRLMFVIVSVICSSAPAPAQTQRSEDKSGNVTYQTGKLSERGRPYAKAHALIIGNGKYKNMADLPGAVADVKELGTLFKQLGFDSVEVRQNLEHADLEETIARFFTLKGDDRGTLLVFWFAGHGQTVDDEGYLVPANAPKPDDAGFRAIAYPFWKLHGYMRQSKAHHVLAVIDSCFSGSFFRRQQKRSVEGIPDTLDYALQNPVRRVITAGNESQRVDDTGAFRRRFVEGLTKGVSKPRTEGFVTGQELFDHVFTHVRRETQEQQTPQTGTVRSWTGLDGDVVFRIDAASLRAERPGSQMLHASTPGPAPRETVTMPQLLAFCRRHANHPQARDIVRSMAANLRGKDLAHTWHYRDKRTADAQDGQMPHGLSEIQSYGNEIHFRMARQESEVVLVPALKKWSSGPASSEVFFEGAWLQDSGYGCVEFIFDRTKGVGTGRWWPKRWYSGAFRGRAITSELKVTAP